MTNLITNYVPIQNAPYLEINGAVVSNNATTPNTQVDVSAGICRDQTNTFDLNIGNYAGAVYVNSTPNIVTTINAATVGLNGIDTGALAASTVYRVYVVADVFNGNQTGAMISLADASVGPLMPFGYNAYRFIGFAITDSSSHFLLNYNFGENASRTLTFDAFAATAITAGASTSYADVALTAFVPAVTNIMAHIYTLFTPAAASNTLSLQKYGATGAQAIVTAQVASVPISTLSSVLVGLHSGAPTVSYKVSAGAVAVSVAGFSYTV